MSKRLAPYHVKPDLTPRMVERLNQIMATSKSAEKEAQEAKVEDKPTEEGEGGLRPPSPTGSDKESVYSYVSSVERQYIVRYIHGRQLNNTYQKYMLPADEDEHVRLDIQHELLKLRMGLYQKPAAVRRALAPRPEGDPPAIIDIGCGSGSWTVEMAKAFPHAEVVGLDLTPAIVSSPIPENCRFECDDANEGLEHYKNSFDVVHARAICGGIKDYPKLLREMVDMLRPGGVLLITEGEGIYGADCQRLTCADENDQSFAWLCKVISAADNAMQDNSTRSKIPGYMRDLKDIESWGSRNFFVHVGPWETDMTEKQILMSQLQRDDFLRFLGSVRPMILINGADPAEVDDWIAKAQDEMINLRRKSYGNWLGVWAIKAQP